MKRIIMGVMGPGAHAPAEVVADAQVLGGLIARRDWVLLTGGRNAGVMEAASRGAREAGGLTIGILPEADKSLVSDYVDIPIFTGMGSARNNINVLSSDVVLVCGIGPGTASEIALAIKAGKPVILLRPDEATRVFCQRIGKGLIAVAIDPEEAVRMAAERLEAGSDSGG